MMRVREAQGTPLSSRFPLLTSLLLFFFVIAISVSCAPMREPPITSPVDAPIPRPSAEQPSGSAAPAAAEPEVESAVPPALVAEAAPQWNDDLDAGEEQPPEEEAEEEAGEGDEDQAPAPHDDLAVSPPAPTPGEVEKERSLAESQVLRFDIPMVVNEKVTAWVDYYSGPHREKFQASLVRSGRYLPMIHRIFGDAGLPRDLAYLAHVESAFKPNAYSRAKAKGMFQFIASTGKRYGLRNDTWVDERSNPEKSARAAAAYLKDLHERFGDWYLALAAYNAGEGKIERAIRRTGSTDFWTIARTATIRNETKNYVPAILAATLIAKDPSKYGFEFLPDAPIEYETVEVTGAVDLRILARRAGLDPESLRALNSEFRRGQTPPGRTVVLRVPPGTAMVTAEAFRTIPPGQRTVPSGRHTVRKGETLGTIAARYHVSVASIQRANKLGSRTTIQAGRTLVIPGHGSPREGMAEERGSSAPASYRVRSGDTLSTIARRFGTTPAAIASASGISVGKTLRVGETLKIRGGEIASVSSASKIPSSKALSNGDAPLVHTVRSGETLWTIAARYRTSIERLCALNDISRQDTLHPGRRLTVRAD